MAGTDPPPRPAPPGFGDLLTLFGSNNPLTAMSKSVDQFRTGVNAFIEAVQTFRQTMDNLNAITVRVNRLLDDVEEPMRAVLPQITASAETASRMIATLRDPVERVAPGLSLLADTLANPLLADLPRRMAETMEVVSALPRALGPLSQMADLAGGLLGGARSFSAMPRMTRVTSAADPAPARPAESTGTTRPTTKKAATKKAAAEKATAKKRAPAKKAATSKAATKKAATRKVAARSSPAKRGAGPR
jgi:ABC-type transporter Mla subunit MlaD